MLKKVLSAVFAAVIMFWCPFVANSQKLTPSAKSSVLLCVESGEFLFEDNADERLSMASTTKIMTALLAIEAATPEREIVVTEKMVSVEGTSMGLKAGDSVSLLELVYGMLLQSGNDAANNADTTTKPEEKKGCKSALNSTYAVLALVAVLGFAFVAKKREENGSDL